MDDFTVYGDSFDSYLDSLTRVLERCIETNLVLNFEKCHFRLTFKIYNFIRKIQLHGGF